MYAKLVLSGAKMLQKGKRKVRKMKKSPTYAKVKAKESSVRGAAGLKGSGRLNKARRAVQGPVGYAALGAAAFSGDDE
jgi:hypothetical protein|tara:strand:- start:1641 stop:1874 length:234 start_codon:yes stop_codon:yes gene_type:complete